MEKERISFKPLHEGMGFHPFSDGLPYAPETKKKPSTGAGATAAGRPRFAQPVRTARQMQAESTLSVRTHEPILRTAPVTPRIAPVAAQIESTEPGLLRRRAFAYALDGILHAGFWFTTNLTALFVFHFQIDPELILQNFGSFCVFFLFSQWLFITLQEVLFETTAGKVFFQLEFERGHRSLLLRSLVFLIGTVGVFGWFFQPQDRFGRLRLRQGSGNA